MARTGFALVVLALCVSASMADSKGERWKLDSTSIQEVLRRFSEDVHSSISLVSPDGSSRTLLGTSGDDTDSSSFHTFLAKVLGKDWKSWVPKAWKLPTFGWDKLGSFDLDEHVGDFLDSSHLADFDHTDVAAFYNKSKAAVDAICGHDKIKLAEKVPPSCTGPSISIDYVPKVCKLNETLKQVACTTPKLTLTKTPASCVLGGVDGAVFKGKSCVLSGQVGFDIEIIAGQAPYTLSPGSIVDKFSGGGSSGGPVAATAPAPAPST